MSKMEKSKELINASSITLKSVYSKDRKLIINPCKDIRSGWYKGVARLSEDEKKKLTYWVEPSSSLTIIHNIVFDLTDPVDKLNWEWVQHSNSIAVSFEECQRQKEALFYVDNEEIESQKSVSADELLAKAMGLIFNDRQDMLADRARILGFNVQDEKPVVIKEMLLKMAKDRKTIQKVIDSYESATVSIHLLFLKARDKNIIKHENGAYLYGGAVLGVTEEAVIKQMQDPLHRELVLELEKEVHPQLHTQESKKNLK